MEGYERQLMGVEDMKAEIVSRAGVALQSIKDRITHNGARQAQLELQILDVDKFKAHESYGAVIATLQSNIVSSDPESATWYEVKLDQIVNRYMVGSCSMYANHLYPALRSVEISTAIVTSNITLPSNINPNSENTLKFSAIHRSLLIKEINGVDISHLDIIVDPTIGQFIKNHHHVFIGTRGALKLLVEESYKDGNIINTDYPEMLFERAWGDQSVEC